MSDASTERRGGGGFAIIVFENLIDIIECV